MLKPIWIDPAEGWRWGFPAIWDVEKHPSIHDLYRAKGYPEKYWHLPCRSWPVKEDEQEQNR